MNEILMALFWAVVGGAIGGAIVVVLIRRYYKP